MYEEEKLEGQNRNRCIPVGANIQENGHGTDWAEERQQVRG